MFSQLRRNVKNKILFLGWRKWAKYLISVTYTLFSVHTVQQMKTMLSLHEIQRIRASRRKLSNVKNNRDFSKVLPMEDSFKLGYPFNC